MTPKIPRRTSHHRRPSLGAAIREIVMIVCGLIMAVVPLALWMAWSRPVFAGILTTCMIAMAVIVVLSRFDDDGNRLAPGETMPGKQTLDDAFHDEMRRHVPLINHRRNLTDRSARRQMARLRALIRRPRR